MNQIPFSPALLLVTDRRRFAPPARGAAFDAAEWDVLEASIEAGVGAIQLREKDLDGGFLYERARRLVSRGRAAGVSILVNDRADVAKAARAAGVHLPGAGLPTPIARSIVGPEARIGRSIHGVGELPLASGADYVIFGPIFETPSKRHHGAPQGLDRLRRVVEAAEMPVVAIGGITVERVAPVLGCGAAGIAVMGALLSAEDPAGAVRAFREALAAA